MHIDEQYDLSVGLHVVVFWQLLALMAPRQFGARSLENLTALQHLKDTRMKSRVSHGPLVASIWQHAVETRVCGYLKVCGVSLLLLIGPSFP